LTEKSPTDDFSVNHFSVNQSAPACHSFFPTRSQAELRERVKDRPENREAFVSQCDRYLREAVAVIVIDKVPEAFGY
jgi:hypothetical protein